MEGGREGKGEKGGGGEVGKQNGEGIGCEKVSRREERRKGGRKEGREGGRKRGTKFRLL